MTVCGVATDGVRCQRRARFILSAPHLGRRAKAHHACGTHLARMIRELLPEWGYVGVGEER